MVEITIVYVDAGDGPSGRAMTAVRADEAVDVVSVPSVADAGDRLGEVDPDCVVADAGVAESSDGDDLVDVVRANAPDAGCLLCVDGAFDGDPPADASVAEYVPVDGPAAADRLARLVAVTAERRSQAAYPLPDDEDERIAALANYDFGDEGLRAALERVCSLARDHFDVDGASIGVVGDHAEEFVCSDGVDVGSLPREETVCTYTILDDEVTVVRDLGADPRGRPLDDGEGGTIRFYAGTPLTVESGRAIGTLCLFDASARDFSSADETYLRRLAAEASDWIETRGRRTGSPDVESTAGARR